MGDSLQSTARFDALLLPSDVQERWKAYRAALEAQAFTGEIADTLAARLVGSTDNSIYQCVPLGIVYPRCGDDLNRVVRAAAGMDITLAVRGGGTGTNGQSLTAGVVVDVSRHLDQIMAFDPDVGTVVVEPGVILSRLNAFLRPHGFFFPPTVSTATRATIGGMIATDASGKGSRIYGRTSDYVTTMDVVLSDGTTHTVRHRTGPDVDALVPQGGVIGRAYREVRRVVTDHAAEIARVFPDMNRGLTGYNLRNVVDHQGGVNLVRLLAGSEGTLALTRQVVLRVQRLPTLRRLIVVRYGCFQAALRHVQPLIEADPTAIEVLDDKILARATQDVTWTFLEGALGADTSRPVEGMSFVEFTGDDPGALSAKLTKAADQIKRFPDEVLDFTCIDDQEIIQKLWTLREQSVGFLGRPDGTRQGVAFVEDTAVPPEHLADYVREFRAILDRHGLRYGMFGHADVGCLHVRPFLDMTDPADQRRIRTISDAVVDLTRRYGGLIWGEHGRGYRGEFSPLYFGDVLYDELCRIKACFDPEGLFNRGKLARSGANYPVDRIDGVPFKGVFDSDITEAARTDFGLAVSCNGNGACFNREPGQAMCPSYKATKDRIQSPKGRATLLRSWARVRSLSDTSDEKVLLPQLTQALKTALDTCLSCKACATQCPIRVDIPTMRSRFLSLYYRDHARPLRDYLIYGLETVLQAGRRVPKLSNVILQSPVSKFFFDRIGFVDLPLLVPPRIPRPRAQKNVTSAWLNDAAQDPLAVILFQDSFTGSFDGPVVDAAYALLRSLGFNVRVSSVCNNGKARHIRGFARGFAAASRQAVAQACHLGATGVPLVSLDAATGLMFEQEYAHAVPGCAIPRIHPLEQFLRERLESGQIARAPHSGSPVPAADLPVILPHCTEQTARPHSALDWVFVLQAFGHRSEAGPVGCCGMAGLFGHEKENAALSKTIFHQNWGPYLGRDILVTGYSCRCQTKRFTGHRPLHPVEWLVRQGLSGTGAVV